MQPCTDRSTYNTLELEKGTTDRAVISLLADDDDQDHDY